VGLAVHWNRGADNSWIASVTLFPQSVAEYRHAPAVGTIFRGSEGAAGDGRGTEECEVVSRDMHRLRLLRMIAPGQVDAHRPEVVGGDLLKNAGLPLPPRELRNAGAGKRRVIHREDQLHQ